MNKVLLGFLPCTVPHCRAEIFTIFGSYFGRNDIIKIFRNLLYNLEKCNDYNPFKSVILSLNEWLFLLRCMNFAFICYFILFSFFLLTLLKFFTSHGFLQSVFFTRLNKSVFSFYHLKNYQFKQSPSLLDSF